MSDWGNQKGIPTNIFKVFLYLKIDKNRGSTEGAVIIGEEDPTEEA